MTTTELIALLKEHEFGGATGRAREVSIQVGENIYETDIASVTTGDGLITELTLKLSAQPEHKKGKWIHVTGYCTPGGDPVWACSECGKGEHVYGIEYQTYSHNVSDGQWVACPNCGARMEEDT